MTTQVNHRYFWGASERNKKHTVLSNTLTSPRSWHEETVLNPIYLWGSGTWIGVSQRCCTLHKTPNTKHNPGLQHFNFYFTTACLEETAQSKNERFRLSTLWGSKCSDLKFISMHSSHFVLHYNQPQAVLSSKYLQSVFFIASLKNSANI